MISNDEPMNARAYVLINIEIGSEEKMMDALKAIPEIKEAYRLNGVYDIIARVESDTMLNLKEAIRRKIRKLEKVRSTLTMIVTNMMV
ncbi:hypothetical protein ES703_15644 [subsurface metagenome]